VSTDATEHMSWTAYIKVFCKVGGCENAIVQMNMFDANFKLCSISFENFCREDHFARSGGLLEVSKEEFAVVIGPESTVLYWQVDVGPT